MDPRRLCHISDLPNNLHFLPIEIKHLLPVHHPRFIDNLHTIVYHQSQRETWPLYPDLSVSLGHPQYAHLSGGWCQDIDGNSQHLKSSLQLSAIVLNYLHSVVQNPAPDDPEQQGQSSAIQRVDHIGANAAPSTPRCPPAIAYNIYKTKDKNNKSRLILIVGQHKISKLRLYSLASAVRSWNLHRLKSDMCRQVSPKRIHKHVEHLLAILRGFLPLPEDDHQAKKKELELIIDQLDCQALPKTIPRDGIQINHQVVVSRFEWVYKDSLNQKQIDSITADALAQLLKIMPINSACSFAGKSHLEPKLNTYVLLWMTCFKRVPNIQSTNQIHLGKAVDRGTSFLRRKFVEDVKVTSTSIADQMLRSSLKVLNKYTPDNASKVKEWVGQAQNSRMQSSSMRSSGVEDRQKSRIGADIERLSMISRISFKDTQSVFEGKARMDAQFQSLSSPLVAHRDRQYSQLLAAITQWQQLHGKVPTWSQLHTLLRRNCQTAKLRYSKSNLSTQQSQLLLSLVAIRRYLDTDQYLILLKYHSEYRQAIFQIIFQSSAAPFLHDLGIKIAKQYGQSLYQHYLTKQFRIDRYSLLTMFMKKMVCTFAPGVTVPNVQDKIDMGVFIELLEGRQFLGEKYKALTKDIIEDLFKPTPEPTPALLLICPILLQIYLALADDHHQELVNGLLGDLAFEVVFFSQDLGQIDNSPYRKDSNLRQRKVMELLREGGFSTLGYQLRNILKPHIIQHSNYILPEARIYHQVVISKPYQLIRFVQLISTSTFVQHLPQITTWFKSVQIIAGKVSKPIANAYLEHQVENFRWQKDEEIKEEVLKSESGIFKRLLEYNPQIKLAGRQLSEVVKQHSPQKANPPQKYDADHILSSIFRQNLQQIYEYIAITSNLKQKYENYQNLLQDQKIYLREIVHQIMCHRTDILDYLYISLLARQANCSQTPSLF